MKNWFLIAVLGIFLIANSACEEGTSEYYGTDASTQHQNNSSTVVESNGHPVEIYAKSLNMNDDIAATQMRSEVRPEYLRKKRSSRNLYGDFAVAVVFYLIEKNKEKKGKAE